MLSGYAAVALLTITLTAAATRMAPQIIIVESPQPYPAPSAPNDTAVYPSGHSRCDVAVRDLMDMASLCLNSYAAGIDDQQWCQDESGCRNVLADLAQKLYSPCILQTRLHPTIANVFDQIAYATSVACSSTDSDSCDIQAELALAMMEFPADRSLLCSPCVKKSFGRMSLDEGNGHRRHLAENIGKTRCNQVEGQYCDLRPAPTSADMCDPCRQRSYAKFHAANARHNVEDRLDRSLRACYDNGHGDSCYRHSMGLLARSYNVTFNEDGTVNDFGDLDVCGRDDACDRPECRSAIESVIQTAGCCASALPVLLLRGLRLPCLEPMIDSAIGPFTACVDPFVYSVEVTVNTTDSAENVCRAVSEDLATTLAVLPDQILCEKFDRKGENDPNAVTVMNSVIRYRTVGMPATVPFDPDLLQYPVVEVVTSEVEFELH